MAVTFKPCSIDGCNGNAHYSAHGAKGYCQRHYLRLARHGDPLAGITPTGEPNSWLDAHIAYDGNECLIWPYSRTNYGYGCIVVDGKLRGAHRIMCLRAHGEPPTPAHEAAHSCGNGHLGCVNPRHLRWDTRAGNFADKVAHGTDNRGEQHPNAKLSDDDVRSIRRLRSTMTMAAIAEAYQVSRSAISLICSGRRWPHI